MSLFDSGYYKLTRWGMMISGTWPGSTKLETWTMRIILIGIEISIIIPEYRYLYKAWGNYNAVIPCIPSQMFIFLTFFKFKFLVGNPKMVRSVISQIANDWKFLSEKSSDQLMHAHGVIAFRKILLFFYIAVIVLLSFFGCSLLPEVLDVILPLNQSRDKIAPFETDYAVDFEDYFYPIILHGALAAIANSIYIWTADTFVIIMVQHCCGLFETTSYILKKLNSSNEKNYSEKYEINVIKFAITIHKRAIAFAEFIEGSVTSMYAFIVLDCMIMISVTGVSAIFRLDHRNEAIRMGVFFCTTVIILLFNTLPSQTLIDESTRLSILIYDCDWTSLTIKSQKLILLMLLRSVRPCCLTAGKVYELNMENFSQVVKTGLSYLAVLLSFQ